MGLLEELVRLRKGRGVNSVRLQEDVGPELRAACGIAPDASPGAVRDQLVRALEQWAERLPTDAAVAARAALALHPAAQQRFVAERTRWLAEHIGRDDRTARRRMDEALKLMAQHAGTPVAAPTTGGPPTGQHYIAEHWVLVRLDRPAPETLERQVIVSHVAGFDEIDTVFSLPRQVPSRPDPRELHMEVLYGAVLIDQVQETHSRFRYRLRLSSEVDAGRAHEYGLLYRIPPDQVIRPHYVFVPHRRCDALTVRIRFDDDRPPTDVRRVDGEFLRDLDDEPVGPEIAVDAAAELHLTFTDLTIGMAYGARWRVAPEQHVDYPTMPAE